MPTAMLRVALRHGGTTPDADLLDRYRADRDEGAFEALVVRHGPTVLGVCRRVLRDRHAADDAFQATFLVLARKASAVRPPELIGAWLYGVAYRTALKARGRGFRRAAVERAASAERGESVHEVPHRDPDLHRLIDEQIAALPEKYRLPVVLCVVQGESKADAAARLGLNEGTLSSRLARGRDLLRDRLERRGVAPVVALAVGGVVPGAELIAATAEAGTAFGLGSASGLPPAVVSLTNEVLGTMNALTWKVAGVLAAVALAVGGTGFALADGDKPKVPEKPAVKKPEGDKPKVGEGDKPKVGDGDKPGVKKPEGDKPKGDGDKPRGRKVGGTATEVNQTAKAITLSQKGDGGEKKVIVTVTDATKIVVDEKEAKLSAVPKNARVEAVVKPGKEGDAAVEATELRVIGREVKFQFQKLDGNKLVYKVEGGERVVELAAGAKVFLGKEEIKLADLKAGDDVFVTMAASDAVGIKVTVRRKGAERKEK